MLSVTVNVNGIEVSAEIAPHMLLIDFLRVHLRLTGTHCGCETASCGACTVMIDGKTAKSCNLLAVQANGCEITTIEGVAGPNGELHPVQQAFFEEHGLQCGFCTPGMVLTAMALLKRHPNPPESVIVKELAGNLCRCTGYRNIVAAIRSAAMAQGRGAA